MLRKEMAADSLEQQRLAIIINDGFVLDSTIPIVGTPLEVAILNLDIRCIEAILTNDQEFDLELAEDALKMLKERLYYNEDDVEMQRKGYDILHGETIQMLFAKHELKEHKIDRVAERLKEIDRNRKKHKNSKGSILEDINTLLPLCKDDDERMQLMVAVTIESALFYEVLRQFDLTILKMAVKLDPDVPQKVFEWAANDDKVSNDVLLCLLKLSHNKIRIDFDLDKIVKSGDVERIKIIYNQLPRPLSKVQSDLLRQSKIPAVRQLFCDYALTDYIGYESSLTHSKCHFFKCQKVSPIDKINAAVTLRNACEDIKVDIQSLHVGLPVLTSSHKLNNIYSVALTLRK